MDSIKIKSDYELIEEFSDDIHATIAGLAIPPVISEAAKNHVQAVLGELRDVAEGCKLLRKRSA